MYANLFENLHTNSCCQLSNRILNEVSFLFYPSSNYNEAQFVLFRIFKSKQVQEREKYPFNTRKTDIYIYN